MSSYLATFSLAGKIALVTGAGRGLGFEIAKAMAGAGAHVVINGRDQGRLDPAVAAIVEAGGAASGAAFDVADPDALRAALAAIEAQHGRLDFVVGTVGQRVERGSLSGRHVCESQCMIQLTIHQNQQIVVRPMA